MQIQYNKKTNNFIITSAKTSPFSTTISAKAYYGIAKSPKYAVSSLISPCNSPEPNSTSSCKFNFLYEGDSYPLYYL